MSTLRFIQDLVELLFRLDQGMQEFEEPPPEQVKEGVMRAVIGFGEQALPAIHKRFAEAPSEVGPTVLDVLGEIANPDSASYIIDFHKHHADFLSGAAAISALKKLKAGAGYSYLCDLLIRRSQGDKRAFNTNLEIVIACQALGEWKNSRAIEPLVEALRIRDTHGEMPNAAINALATYPEAQQRLLELAEREPALKEIIHQSLSDQGRRQ